MTSIVNLDTASKLAIEIAQKLAIEENHPSIGPPHLLMALLNERVGITSFLTVIGKDLSYLKSWAQYRIEEYHDNGLPDDDPKASKETLKVLDVAKTFQLMFNQKHIKPISLLCALTRPEVGFPKGQIGSLRLTEEELVQAVLSDKAIDQVVTDQSPKSNDKVNPSETKAFLQYCIDKLALAQGGKIDPIYGRDKEIREMENILCRRSKPNVIVTGEPGVGKTALVDGFALNIIEKNVSEYFRNAKLYQLDVGALVAGASYRGEVEDRLRKVLTEIKRLDHVILFIDEIHMILDSNSGAAGIANLLKPELARGELNLIGATTTKEYRLHIEKDPAFARRFEVLQVDEPSIEKACLMVNGLKSLFEDHHKFGMNEDAVNSSVKLAKRYFPQRFLPDSAIDLMDRTMASFRIMEDNLSARLEKVDIIRETLSDNVTAKDVINFWDDVKNIVSPLAFDDYEIDEPTDDKPESWLSYVKSCLDHVKEKSNAEKTNISENDIARIVALTTGIPIGKIGGSEQEKLLNLETELKKRVIGQDHAADIIAKAIRRSRSGIKEKGKPIGNFFLVGPTGTGKTELAKSLTELLFNDSSNLIRFDMSEYMEPHSVSLLKGSPPGYVGYGEGGLLVNAIREKPYSVVLFDEVEKAHPDVFKLLLQVLDEGHLHDTLGKKGTFTDAVILFTSNAEAEWVVSEFEKGNHPDETELRDRMVLRNHFRPEFLNRLDAIIPFAPLNKSDLLKILEIQLRSVKKLLAEKRINLKLDDRAKGQLTELGYSPAFGARPIKRAIDSYLLDEISELIISNKVKPDQEIQVSWNDREFTFDTSKQ